MENLLTVQEVAEMLRVSTATVFRLLNEKKIQAAKVGGQWRVTPAQVDDFLKRHTIGPDQIEN